MQLEWKIWLDNNLSPVIARRIIDKSSFTAKSCYVLNTAQLDDFEFFRLAKAAGNIIILTKDTDFENIVARLGAPPKIISLGFGNCSNDVLWAKLKPKLLFTIDVLTSMDLDFIQID